VTNSGEEGNEPSVANFLNKVEKYQFLKEFTEL